MLNLNLVFGQVEKIPTDQIKRTLIDNGLDSAMNYFSNWYHIPIYKIDMQLCNEIVSKIDTESYHVHFLLDVANNVQNKDLSDKIYSLFNSHCLELKSTAVKSEYTQIKSINDSYLSVLLKQENDSLEYLLVDNYQYWNNAISEVRKISRLKRFFKSLGGDYLQEDCHYNCLINLLGLKDLNSKYYSDSLEHYHRANVRKYQKDNSLGQYNYRFEYKEYDVAIINLDYEYEDLGEIDFERELKLMNYFKEYPDNINCWRTLIYNDKSGILDLGCQYAPLAGHGNRYRIELIENNKLKIITLQTWIS